MPQVSKLRTMFNLSFDLESGSFESDSLIPLSQGDECYIMLALEKGLALDNFNYVGSKKEVTRILSYPHFTKWVCIGITMPKSISRMVLRA